MSRLLPAGWVQASDHATQLAGLGLKHGDPERLLGIPSAWQVFGAFVLVSALAVAWVAVLRRLRGVGPRVQGSGNQPHVVSSRNLSATGRIHVVEIDGRRFLVVESRHGVGISPVDAGTPASGHGGELP